MSWNRIFIILIHKHNLATPSSSIRRLNREYNLECASNRYKYNKTADMIDHALDHYISISPQSIPGTPRAFQTAFEASMLLLQRGW